MMLDNTKLLFRGCEDHRRRNLTNMKLSTSTCIFGAFLLLVAQTSIKGEQPSTDVPHFTAQGAFFAIVVTDLDSSIRWYESKLGLRLIKEGKAPKVPAETAVLGGHNVFVELIHHDGKSLSRLDNEASVPRLIKAGMVVGQKDFDAMAVYLQKTGIETAIFEDKEMRVRSFLVRDNDGNILQFFTQTDHLR